eukprot:gene18553-22149_t
MGPKCWSEEKLAALLDAGMGVARFNFSHGEHAAHQEVLDRFRKVCKEKGSHAACLLDTKGPEIRTAMLRDHQAIELEAGQEILVYAAGAEYTTFEGYKTPEETKIGVSYEKLCQSVKPGNRMLFADGTLSIEVVEILDDKTLKGKVLNTKKLGERKNGNLPGVKVDIPVLTAKDISDLQEFCCKNAMDYVAASFVQTGEDVQYIRKILDDAGGTQVKIISKIENEEGLANFDDILKYTDGVMVARGDLGMEIPSEKVALAQKMLATKCNIAGKFCICATQMLESMIENPSPTRAEMTDVANAVFDGCDATMLSGETANGGFPDKAVRTMAAIAENCELGLDSYAQMQFTRYWNFANRGMGVLESSLFAAAKAAVEYAQDKNGDGVIDASEGALILVLTETGLAADLVSKYRPPCAVFVASPVDAVLRQCNTRFAQYPFKPSAFTSQDQVIKELSAYMVEKGYVISGKKLIVVTGRDSMYADTAAAVKTVALGDKTVGASEAEVTMKNPLLEPVTTTVRATKIGLDLVSKPTLSAYVPGPNLP